MTGWDVGTPVIFLDRDGVLSENRPDYVKSWDEFRFLPGTANALQRLAALGLPIIVITNQAGVGRQIMSAKAVEEIHQRMIFEITRMGGRIDAVYYCPHQTSDRCGCRKPKRGLLFQAVERFDDDLSLSVFLGDADTDSRAGMNASCRTVLVLAGRGSEFSRQQDWAVEGCTPDATALDLMSAVPVIARMTQSCEYILTTPVRHEWAPAMAFTSSED